MEEFERIADVSDRASAEEERATKEAQILQRMKEKPVPSGWDKETCYECGEPLPVERIQAKRFLCVGCKTAEEIREKRSAR